MVFDVKLSINILDSELISPVFHYQVTVDYLIKDLIAKHVTDALDREIEDLKTQYMDEGKPEINDTETIFEKIKQVDNHVDDEVDQENSNRYRYVAKNILDRIENLRAEIDPEEYDALNIRENIKKVIDNENIRNRGFNTAINSITSILDTSKMGYQHIENFKNARYLVIREFEDEDVDHLPDERYEIRLIYYDQAQLEKERSAYDRQMKEFEREIKKVWDTVWGIYQDKKKPRQISDFDDLMRKTSKRRPASLGAIGEMMPEVEGEKTWNELNFIPPEETEVEKRNRNYLFEKSTLKNRLILIRNQLKKMFGYHNPLERLNLEKRLTFLERKFDEFNYKLNPYHVQPGVLLDLDITSIKKKKTTLMSMANVLNEFLHGISKGFQDAAFATFARRRSTMRTDLEQTFEAVSESDIDLNNSSDQGRASTEGVESSSESPMTGEIRSEGESPQEEDEDLKEL